MIQAVSARVFGPLSLELDAAMSSTDPNFSYSHSVHCRIGVVDVVHCTCGQARAPLTQNPQKIGSRSSRVEPYVDLEPSVRRVVRRPIMFGEAYEPYVPPRTYTPSVAHTLPKRRKIASSKPRIVSLWDVVSMSDLDLDLSGAE